MQFFDEAKKLLDLENGRASLPTVQGLTLLFTLSAFRGTDRAGMVRNPPCTDTQAIWSSHHGCLQYQCEGRKDR